MNIFNRLFLLGSLSMFSGMVLQAQCLQGNCIDGYGLLRTDQTYQLGTWKNSKAEGEGMRVVFHQAAGYGGRSNTEADFLLLTAFETPTIEAVLKLKPQVVIKGVFSNGELNSTGELWATDIKTLPELSWLLRFTERWIGGTWSWERMQYKGEFSNTKPSGFGSMMLAMKLANVTCTGKNLANPDHEDLIVEAESPQFKNKRLFRGSFQNGVPHGFAITNFDSHNQRSDSLRRQLWLYGQKSFTGETGLYPADEVGAVRLKLPDGTQYTGPVDAQKKPIGFGRQVQFRPDGKKEWTYTGYFAGGHKSGPGVLERFEPYKQTLAGNFSKDSFLNGTVYAFGQNYFWETTVSRYHPKTLRPMGATGYEGRWESRAAYERGAKAVESYWGGFNEGGFYEGQGTVTTANGATRAGIWRNGNLAQQQSGEIDYYSLYENCVIVLNGMASPIKRDPATSRWVTLAGEVVPASGKLRLSKYSYQYFFGSCAVCNGSGKEAKANRVEAKTTAFTSSFSSVQGGGPYMDSYWIKTTTSTTSYTIPAYTTYTYHTCTACKGGGRTSSLLWVKED